MSFVKNNPLWVVFWIMAGAGLAALICGLDELTELQSEGNLGFMPSEMQ